MENRGKIIFDIIQELCDRAGFDDWWHNLDSDIQEEIHEALVKKLPIHDVSGMACECGNQIFTHRHSNWIECTACNKIHVLQA